MITEFSSDAAGVIDDVLLVVKRVLNREVTGRQIAQSFLHRWREFFADVVNTSGGSRVGGRQNEGSRDVLNITVSPAPMRMVARSIHGAQVGIGSRSIHFGQAQNRSGQFGAIEH